MDISSLLNPVKPNISPRNRHAHPNLHDVRSGADLPYPLENSVRSEVLKKSHPPRVKAQQRLGVTREGSTFIHCCERREVNEPLARLHLSNKDSNHGGLPPSVGVSPGYSSLAFSNSHGVSRPPSVQIPTSRFRTADSVQHRVVDILPSSYNAACDTHLYKTGSRSTGSSISSPTSLVGLRGSPIHSPCSMAAESSVDGGRSIFSGSPPDDGHLSSPTNSLIAFASVAVGDYGFMTSGSSRAAETKLDRGSALISSIDSMFRNPGPFYRETSNLPLDADKKGGGGLSDRLLAERMATINSTSQPGSYPSYCVSPRSQFRESFERTHCQGEYSCVQAGLGNGSAASPTTSNQSMDSLSDGIAVFNGYPHPGPSLGHFSPSRQGITPLPPAFELQTRIPTASSPVPGAGVANNSCVKNTGPRCSYTSSCTTGSPLRKVVSHIFGRNKLCTRQIPKGVWVHYCRKHYQRSRYRNPRGFALLQCDLVRKQIKRLQGWGGVTDWMIKVRKREEERLNKENAETLAVVGALNSVDIEGNNSRTTGSGGNRDGTTPSSSMVGTWGWLVQSTGSGKSTMDVLKILDRIEGDIASSGSNFPDVEILPVVVAAATTTTTASALSDEVSSSDLRIDLETLSSPGTGAAHPPPQQRSVSDESHYGPTIEVRTPRKRRIGAKPTVPNPSPHQNAESLHPVTVEHRQTKRVRLSPTTMTVAAVTKDETSEVTNRSSTVISIHGTGITTGPHNEENDGREVSTMDNTSMTTTRRRSLRRSTRASRPTAVA